ncbi:MAG: DNA gyrase subunit A [Candidatus Omnitrophica bacterium]|nr:DNA gyrase subunit A [Candidatus Omnitrophota bacterium]MDE2009532.1 DNA gyrase subunit A [Candidatus Omnitrophota bacterium]MDE2214576.1 DNA gyrase subunit A [Candidatus Omnitrophota bacterium]MDE2231653.1 DNA gyrase subunit A [Candidatus Omnitrophota bacterium]
MSRDLNKKERVLPVYIEEEMKNSYLSYSMSVIVGRALPDVRDGLKPVHRRILYAMKELSLEHNKPYKKSARIVGEVLGKYHPHGDTAVYDTMVRMVQDFSLRYPLIDGQGNFGSIDGDAAAAMRYTEARMDSVAEEMLNDIEKQTVDFSPNFDGSLEEPDILPGLIPNLLVNGSSGIAVGMATNMAPHNLGEVVEAIVHLLDNPEASVKELTKFVKGPDFPTGGIICGREGFIDAYNTGRGKVTLRARASIEQQKGNREAIIITEVPYQVNKANLISTMADLVQNKQIDGITDIRDESDKDGIRVVIELRRDADANIVLNYLFKHTQMEVTFGIINLALVNKSPHVLNLKQLMGHYISHRRAVIRRRTQFDLDKALRRAHILEGLRIAFKHLDEIIKTIRASKTTADAKEALVRKFDLSGPQAQAILEMQLQRLAALERDKIEAEYQQLLKDIDNYRAILASEKRVDGIIKEELGEVKKKYADERRTEIAAKAEDIEIEDMIADEDMAITISNKGYVKRLSVDAYRSQKRGGKGVTAMTTSEEDFVERMFVASSKDFLLIFSNAGTVRWLKVYEIPVASRAARGKAIVNLLSFKPEEKISAIVAVKEFREDQFLVFATRQGLVKKTKISAYNNPRKGGIVGIGLEKGDELIGVGLSNGKEDVFLATREGGSLRFPEKQLRDMGRAAKGVRGISLEKGDFVVGMLVFVPDIDKTGAKLLTVCELGYAKRSDFAEYRTQSRAGKGIINVKLTDKNGPVVGVMAVSDADEIMAVTKQGMVVRSSPSEIRETGRSAVGVRLISLDAGDKVSSIAHVVVHEEE